MTDLNWKVVGLFIAVGLISGIIGYVAAPSEITGFTKKEVNTKVSEAVNQSLFSKNIEIDALNKYIEELEGGDETVEDKEEEEIDTETTGYLIDELYLSTPIEDIYYDREVSTLFDGEVDFDGKDYDAEETLILKDIELLANENDFEGKVYMIVPEGAIEYRLEFGADLNKSLIDEEETLVFNFLGSELEVSEWIGDEMTFSKGTEYFISEGQSITFEGKEIVLDMVLDEAVYVTMGSIARKIYEGKTKTVGGIEIKVKEVLYTEKESKVSKAVLVIGEEVEVTVENGEEYEEDSPWEWIIDANSVGIVLMEDFTEIDSGEDFQAVGVGKKLCLPDDYVCVRFDGMDEGDTEEYLLEIDEKSGKEYVRIEGNFLSGIEDYGRIYVNTTGIYDRNLDLIDSDEIELANTDSILNISTGDLVFEDFEVNFDLDTTNVGDDDEDYLTDYGILIMNIEDAIDDNEFNIFVPEERLEGSIILI